MGGWRLNKEEFERCKKEAVEKTVEKFFPDIEGKEKRGGVSPCILEKKKSGPNLSLT